MNCQINGMFSYHFDFLNANVVLSAVRSVTVLFPDTELSSVSGPSLSTHSAPPPTPFPSLSLCPGVPLIWDIGPFFSTYPFTLHDVTSTYRPGYRILRIDQTGAVWIVSDTCSGSSTNGDPCRRCASVDVYVDVVRHRASVTAGIGYSHRERSNTQLLASLSKAAESEKKLQLEVRTSS